MRLLRFARNDRELSMTGGGCLFDFALLCFSREMKTVANNSSSYPGSEKLRLANYITINIFGFAINVLWNPMSTIILPIMVLYFVNESQKNTYLGLITLAGIVLAIIVQPIAGAMSDRPRFAWGKRRPYILAGALLVVLLLMTLGWANSLATLFLIYCLLQVASNIANGPWNGFIPDLVPQNKRGLASGVKAIVEVLGAIIGIQLIGFMMSDRFAADGDIKLFLSLGVIAVVMLGAMLATVLTVKERPGTPGQKVLWLPVLYRTFQMSIKSRRDFIYFLVSRLLFLIPLFVLRTFGLYIFKDVAEVADPVATIADLTVVLGICLLIAVLPMGYIADRVGRRPIVAAAGCLGVIGFLILLFFQTHTYIMIGGGLIGLANGAFMSANWALATDLVDKGDEARFLGLTNLATGGASLIATFAGPVMDLFYNLAMPKTGYQIVLAICIVLFIISAMLVFRVKAR